MCEEKRCILKSKMDSKTKFLKIYANLPLAMREEIIVVIGDEPLTWNAAKLEIEQETIKSKEMLKILEGLKIIK